MRIMRWVSILAASLLVLSTQALAEGNAANGLDFAKAECAICHAIGTASSVSPNMKAPPFTLIAQSKMLTEREIVTWLMSSHPDMPGMNLTAQTRDNLLAYIKSLAAPR